MKGVDVTDRFGSRLSVSEDGTVVAISAPYNDSGTLQWTKQFGTATYDRAYGVATDSSNNLYVTGHTYGSLGGTNAGAFDVYLEKYITVI
jgi:hypothetical protein